MQKAFKRKYVITIEGERPPRLMIGDCIGENCVVIKMEKEELPLTVDVSWLVERYGVSSKFIRTRLANFNIGTEGKFRYVTQDAMLMLENEIKKTFSRRKN